MVDDFNLHVIENISEDLSELSQAFENSISHYDIRERFNIRAKSAYYQTLSSLVHETINLKQNTFININQLKELRRKINNLLILADEIGIASKNEQLINRIQANNNFKA